MTTLYTLPGCVQCDATVRHFSKNGIVYEVFDVSVDEGAFRRVSELGYSQAPVVVAPNGDHWSGFRPDLIDRIVA